jgi:hypothetical protein
MPILPFVVSTVITAVLAFALQIFIAVVESAAGKIIGVRKFVEAMIFVTVRVSVAKVMSASSDNNPPAPANTTRVGVRPESVSEASVSPPAVELCNIAAAAPGFDEADFHEGSVSALFIPK